MRLPFTSRSRPGVRPTLAPKELATTWQLVSLLIDYPSEALLTELPGLRQEAAGLPAHVGEPLVRFCDHAAATEARQLRIAYVDTFDHTRRCCLYLSYFEHGDTRKRGVALVEFKQAYRRAGVEFDADELPDHLAVVCEFGACHDAQTSWRLLNRHRAGLEVLRQALAQRSSPWSDVVQALCATLPALTGDEAEQLRRLIEQGPPKEDVGMDLTPYLIDPQIAPRPATGARPGPVPVELGVRP